MSPVSGHVLPGRRCCLTVAPHAGACPTTSFIPWVFLDALGLRVPTEVPTFVPAGSAPLRADSLYPCCLACAPRYPSDSLTAAPWSPHREPFVLAKLRPEDGLYLIHWSTSHLNRLILTVAQREQVSLGRGSWAGAGCASGLDPCSPPCPPAPTAGPGHTARAPAQIPH